MSKQSPLVSVIIPTYNRAWALSESIDSVLNQDYPNFELIVVDDGSTDETKALLKAYNGRLTALYQENRGVSSARNTGIANAHGAYIAFLDSDDLWEKEKLSAQIKFFKENPDALICQTEEIWIRNGKRVNPKFKHKKPSGMIFEQSLHLCLVSPSAVMMKRELFQMTGLFDESLLSCEDYDLWLRISVEHPIYLTPEPLVIKKGGHDDQLSSAPGLDKYRIISLRNILVNKKLPLEYREKTIDVLRSKCIIYANGCARRGRSEEAEYFRRIAETY